VGVRLSEEEAWDFVSAAHTGIVVTLRRDGRPMPLPVWFVVLDRQIYLSTPAGAKKVARIRNDDRASFLVESGEAWTELAAVALQVRATVVEDETVATQLQALMDAKYAAYGVPRGKVPEATRKHYSSRAIIRLEPLEPAVSWNNAKIRLAKPDESERTIA
jgi:nitroimidazol reductase NimA-like FMN-containing flavoprotein (pyridoxamine 5'-phosphate oxidase superfamily)